MKKERNTQKQKKQNKQRSTFMFLSPFHVLSSFSCSYLPLLHMLVLIMYMYVSGAENHYNVYCREDCGKGDGYDMHAVAKASTCCDEDCPDEEDVHLHLFIWNGSAKKGRQGGGAGEGMGGVETERKFAPKKHQNTHNHRQNFRGDFGGHRKD